MLTCESAVYLSLDECIRISKAEVKDQNCQVYLNSIPRAIEEFGKEGLRCQMEYCLASMSSWRGESARTVKASIRHWLSENK